jgi:HEAT repeat protein
MHATRIRLVFVLLSSVVVSAAHGREPDEDVAKFIANIKDPKIGAAERTVYFGELKKHLGTSKAVVPFLIESLGDPKCVADAVNVLHGMGPAAKPALPALIAALRLEANTNGAPRIFETLARIGATPVDLLEPLCALIDDERIKKGTETSANYITRHQMAIDAIGKMGRDGRVATSLLVGLLNSPEGMKQDNLARHVLDALLLMEPDPKEVLPALQPFTQSKTADVKRTADVAIARIGQDPEAVKREVNLFLTAFANKNAGERPRRDAMDAFAKLGPFGKAAVPGLVAALNDADLQLDAMKSLGAIGPEAREAVPALVKLADDRAKWAQLVEPLLESLRTIEPEGTAQATIIQSVLQEYMAGAAKYRTLISGPQQVDGALAHIQKMGPRAAVLVPVLVDLLKMMVADGFAQAKRDLAIPALAAIGPGAKSALPVLDAGLKAERFEPQLVQDAVIAIQNGGAVGVNPTVPIKPAVDPEKAKELIAGLKDPVPAKRKAAILALAAAGTAGRIAEPALVELLRDPDREVRLLAAYALERLETGK